MNTAGFPKRYSVRKKVLEAFNKIKRPVLVEHTVLELEVFHNLPGLRTRDFCSEVGFENIHGAGISASVELPAWSELISSMGADCGIDSELFKNYGDYMLLAEYADREGSGVYSKIREQLDVSNNRTIREKLLKSEIYAKIYEMDYVLFLGYSLSDINVKLLLYMAQKRWETDGKREQKSSYIFTATPNYVQKEVFEKNGIISLSGDIVDKKEGTLDFLEKLSAYVAVG